MGQGGRLNFANVTPSKLERSYVNSYQMAAWENLPNSIESFGRAQGYVEWDEDIFKTWGDDSGEARYRKDNVDLFEIQARWRTLRVYCKTTDPNLVIGVLSGSNLDGGNVPGWHPLKNDALYDIGWNHDGDMSVALIDLTQLFVGPTLDEYRAGVASNSLTDTQKKTLYSCTQAGSGYSKIVWNYELDEMIYEKPTIPEGRAVAVGNDQDVKLVHGSKSTYKFAQQIKRVDTFSWGFKETLGIDVKIGATVGIPGTASTSTDVTVKLGFEANQQVTTTDESTYIVEDVIELQGPGDFKIIGFVDMVDDLEIPFKAHCHVSAKLGEHQLTAHVIDILLNTKKYGNGFTGKIDKYVDDHTVEAVIAGSFRGTYGVKRRVIVSRLQPKANTPEVVQNV